MHGTSVTGQDDRDEMGLCLEPPQFVPPTYLAGAMDRLFVRPPDFWDEWRQGRERFLLFTDPERGTERLAEFPQPCYVIDRNGAQLLLSNQPRKVKR